MSDGKRYLLDSNVFIEAHRKYYSRDFCPAFWLAMVRECASNRVSSIDKVKTELLAGHDQLSDWVANTAPTSFFKGTADINVVGTFRAMANWVQQEVQYSAQAKADFASVADGWLIAYAKTNDLVVVTQEEQNSEIKRKVPIPNVCIEFDVDYCNTFEMLHNLKVRFVLKKRRKS